VSKPIRRSRIATPNEHKRAQFRVAELDRLNQVADELNAEAADTIEYQVPIESILDRKDD